MMLENDRLGSDVADMTGGCCVELFAAYGLVLLPGAPDFVNSEETLLSGVIGFVGPEVRGTCLLVASRAPIELSSPKNKQANTRDWIGELTNQLVGRLKRKFLGHNLEIMLTTPVVLSGVHLRPLPRSELAPRVFTTESGSVMVWVEVEAEPGFAIGPPVSDMAGTEGDILVF